MASSKESLPTCVQPLVIKTCQNAIEIANILRWLLGDLRRHRRGSQQRRTRSPKKLIPQARETRPDDAEQTAKRSRPPSQNHHRCLCGQLPLPGGAWLWGRSLRGLRVVLVRSGEVFLSSCSTFDVYLADLV